MKTVFKFPAFSVLLIACMLTACGGGGGGGGGGSTPTYTVTYDGNASTVGSVPMDSTRYEEGAVVTVRGNTGTLERDGYSFAGWCVNDDGVGTSYIQGQTFSMGAANVILYAKWTQNPTYTVTYDDNAADSGSVPIDSTNYEEGAVVTVLGNTGNLERDGYSFAGWCVSDDGVGTSYTQGQSFSMGTADVILYAKWTANPTYTVTYDGNGADSGNVPVDSTNYEEGIVVTVLGNTGNLARDHYTFAAWCVSDDGIGTSYTQGQSFSMGTADVILYAKWTANPTYTVTYDGNGADSGNVPVDSTNYEEGIVVTVLGNTGNLARDHYTFAGWCVSDDGVGTSYTQGQTFSMGATGVILYAKWTENPTYTVTYDGNANTAGSVPLDSTNYEEGDLVTVLGNTGNLERDGYTFVGWCVNDDGTGDSYTQGQTFSMGATGVILYAKWTENPTYTMTYDGNANTAGSVPLDSTNYEVGDLVTVLGNTGNLARDHYTFAGWCVNDDGTGDSYTQGETFIMGAAGVILYAKWTENPTYTVTYDGNGNTAGSVPVDSTNYEVGDSVTMLGNTGNLVKIQESESLLFVGWNTLLDGSGTMYIAGQSLTMGTGDVVLYAVWVPYCTGILDATFGTGGVVTTLVGTGVDAALAMSVQTDGKIVAAGYSWNESSSNSTLVRYDAEGTPDESFGTSGIVTTSIGSGSSRFQAMSIQADGKIVAAGYSSNGANYDFAVARYNTDGSLDEDFGTGGIVITPLGSSHDVASALSIQADGKIVVAGYSSNGANNDFALVRYNTDGSTDAIFGTGGIVTISVGLDDAASAVTIQVDGKIVMAGYSNNGANYDFALVRCNTDGSLDESFGTGGIVTTPLGSGHDVAAALSIQTDGKIVVAGYSSNGANNDFALVRYDTDGSVDESFGTSGVVTTPMGPGTDAASSLSIQADGKIVAAGYSYNGTNNDFALVRYDTDGNLDDTFGTGGIATTAVGSYDDIASALFIQVDGKIVAAGYSYNGTNNDFALVRYE